MAEIILGVGQQKSIGPIIERIESEIANTQGHPRKVTATGRNVEVVAERSAFEGPFQTYQFRIGNLNSNVRENLSQRAREYQDCCKITEEDGALLVDCKPENGVDQARVLDAAAKISECLPLPEVWKIQGDHYRIEHISAEKLFKAMVQYKASDVHLAPGEVPVFRVDNDTHRSEIYPPLSGPQITTLLREIAAEQYWQEFREEKQTSFNYHQAGLGYSRVSAFTKGGAPHLTFRYLPENIPSFDELHIPSETMEKLASLRHGLILLTGMTGSGKTTTAASLINWINAHQMYHILTIENPVEYVHHNNKSLISQRSIGADIGTFNDAVTGALRHDPDVIVIGEMRDTDTIRSAINAAATGHLVISTLHSGTAYEVIARITSFFDPIERDLVRIQLRECIKCIICQRLLPKKGGGRIPALEILFNDIKAITDGIMAGDSDMIRIGMQQTTSHSMIFERYIHRMYKEGLLSVEVARNYCTDESVLDQMIMGTYTIPRLESIKSAHMGHKE